MKRLYVVLDHILRPNTGGGGGGVSPLEPEGG